MANSSDLPLKMENFMEKVELINFYDPKTQHDRILVVEGKKFHVQSGILAASSEYFRGLFMSNFTEANQQEIVLEDVDTDRFEFFLKMIYPSLLVGPANLSSLDTSDLLGLMALSFRFLSPSVYQRIKLEINCLISAYGLRKFNLTEFTNFVILYDIEEFKECILKSLRDAKFSLDKKEEIMSAPENVKNFILNAYLEGKLHKCDRPHLDYGGYKRGGNRGRGYRNH